MPNAIKYRYILAGLGLISGFINIFFLKVFGGEGIGSFVMFYGASIPFGLLTGWYLCQAESGKRFFLRLIAWTIASGISYFSAVWITLWTSPIGGFALSPTPFNFLYGGLLGGLIVSFAFSMIFRRLRFIDTLLIMIIGGLVAWGAVAATGDLWYLLYPIWQTVVAGLLGWAATRGRT